MAMQIAVPGDARVPRWRPGLAAVVVDRDAVLVYAELRRVVLRGDVVAMVAAQVDGNCSIAEIVERVSVSTTHAEALWVLEALRDRGYLEFETDALPKPRPRVALRLIGLDGMPLALAFEAAGLVVADATSAVDFEVIAVADLLDPKVPAAVDAARARGRPVLIARPTGRQA